MSANLYIPKSNHMYCHPYYTLVVGTCIERTSHFAGSNWEITPIQPFSERNPIDIQAVQSYAEIRQYLNFRHDVTILIVMFVCFVSVLLIAAAIRTLL